MLSWNDLLDAVVEATRARKAAQVAEDNAKAALLTAFRLTNPEVNLWPLPAATVIVKRKTNIKILKPKELVAILGKHAEQVLEPSVKKIWAVLSKDPALMAKALATGSLGLTATDYVECTLRGDQDAVPVEEPREQQVGVSEDTRPAH